MVQTLAAPLDQSAHTGLSVDPIPAATEPSAEAHQRISCAIVIRQHMHIRERLREKLLKSESALTSDLENIEIIQSADRRELKVIDLPTFKDLPAPSNESFAAMQEWEGVISRIEDGTIYADLIDITNKHRHFSETVEIPISELSENDRNRAVLGAIFRWAIGYIRKQSGQRVRSSVIYLRRIQGRSIQQRRCPPPLEFDDQFA